MAYSSGVTRAFAGPVKCPGAHENRTESGGSDGGSGRPCGRGAQEIRGSLDFGIHIGPGADAITLAKGCVRTHQEGTCLRSPWALVPITRGGK